MPNLDRRTLTQLRDVLADLFPRTSEMVTLLRQAEIRVANVALPERAIDAWSSILEYAGKTGRVETLLDAALQQYPEIPHLKLARERGRLTAATDGPAIDEVPWQPAVEAGRLEKIIGERSALVPVSFLESGLQAARSVVRVVLGSGASGTGFLTAGDLLVTNNHVIATPADAAEVVVEFNYQKTLQGLDAPVATAPLLPDDLFVTSVEDDWTIVRVADRPCERWGAIAVADVEVEIGGRVNIIQHPGGGPKQLAFFHNLVTAVGGGRVQYLTDTLPGSSGAPVFDREWRLVALHHSGGWLREPGGASKAVLYRNQGIHVGRLFAALRAHGLQPAVR